MRILRPAGESIRGCERRCPTDGTRPQPPLQASRRGVRQVTRTTPRTVSKFVNKSRRASLLQGLRAPDSPTRSLASRFVFTRGASPLGLPSTRSREPLRLYPRGIPPPAPPTPSREPLRRLAPIAWLASLRSLASSLARRGSP